MKLTLDISDKEFDGVVGADMEVAPTISLNFPSDIRGVYEFQLVNATVNIYDFKDQVEEQGVQIEDDSLFVFGKMIIRIEGVKGADFEFVEGNIQTGRKRYHTWPYTLNKGDVVCMCGGNLSFLSEYYASVIIVSEDTHKITVTFNIDEAVPYDFTNSYSLTQVHSKATKFKHTSSSGKLFNFNFFQEHLSSGRKVVKSE